MIIFSHFLNYVAHRLVAFQNFLLIRIVIFRNKSKRNFHLTRLGSYYGGWWLPTEQLGNTHAKRLVISAGLGHDTTFDRSVLGYGFYLIGLDPLPECVELARRENPFPNARFLNIGLGAVTGDAVFYSPKNKSHDSWSLSNVQRTSITNSRVFSTISIKDLLQQNPFSDDFEFVMLKMDIEGGELDLLLNCNEIQVFDFVAVEMDCLSLIPFKSMKRRIHTLLKVRLLLLNLRKSGFEFIHQENFNFFWVKKII